MSIALESGKLRHRITIERQANPTSVVAGSKVQAWEALHTNVPASVEVSAARETYAADKIETQATHVVSIRYMSGITAKDRIKFGTRIFKIAGVVNVEERNITLKLFCHEVF